MTIPDEEIRALQIARRLLLSIAAPRRFDFYGQQWKRVPMPLRKAAITTLRHYPGTLAIARTWKP